MCNLCYKNGTFQIKLSRLWLIAHVSAIHHFKALNLAILSMYGNNASSEFKIRVILILKSAPVHFNQIISALTYCTY